MPDDLYDRDVLAWSEHQAGLLRRVARGERVNGVDWAHVVEEIEDVGFSELHAVESYLELVLVHLLKTQLWPNGDALTHWQAEFVAFQNNANRRFTPAMRQRIDLANIYRGALRQIVALNSGARPPGWPEACPFTLDALLNEDWADLNNTFQTALSQA